MKHGGHKNDGVIVSGGQIMAGAISAGQNARARGEVHVVHADQALDLLRAQVSRLIELLQDQGAQLDPAVQTSVAALKAETDKAEPDKSKVLALLQKIADGAKSVGTIVQSVAAVAKTAASVFI